MKFEPENTIIVFDVHHVLFKPHYREVVSLIWRSDKKFTLFKYCFYPQLLFTIWRMWRKNVVADAYFEYIRKNYPELAPCIPLVVRMANAQLPNYEVLDTVKRLKQEGYILHILSNIDKLILADLRQRYGFAFDYFDAIKGTSLADPYSKPDISIFRTYVREFNPDHKKMIFIDNKKKNLDSGALVGMQGILFKSANQLKTALKKLGINA